MGVMEGLDVKLRALYLLFARAARMLFAIYALRSLIDGNATEAAAAIVLCLICDAQARITKLEREVDNGLQERDER